jgi:glycosyltransferase involved in cell wall biosynthesis
MINVCVVNPNFYRSSGVTTAIRRIFEVLPADEVVQYFVDCDYGTETAGASWLPRERVAVFPLMSLNPVTLANACARFLRWLRHSEIHVVHVHHRRLAALLGLLQMFQRFELIYTGNLTYRYDLMFWLLSPKVATGVSPSVIENIRRTTRARQIHLISNSCEFPGECPSIEVTKVNGTAICIARLEPVKAHDKLLEAWRMLLDRGHSCRLLLVGEGSLRGMLQDQARVLGIDHLVEFRGFIRNVSAEIERALFAVLPSRLEGQGIVTLESAACGRASLVTDVDGSRDCVPPDHGLPNRIEFGDVPALADALEQWFLQPERVVAEGRRFFEFLKESSSSAVVAGKYRALYEQAAVS